MKKLATTFIMLPLALALLLTQLACAGQGHL